jgi:hypothetical protein
MSGEPRDPHRRAAFRLLAATWRIDAGACVGSSSKDGPPRLVGFWHGKYFALLALLAGSRGEGALGQMRAALRGTPVSTAEADDQSASSAATSARSQP